MTEAKGTISKTTARLLSSLGGFFNTLICKRALSEEWRHLDDREGNS